MVARRRLPSATYHSPYDEAWTRDTFADQMIAVHDNQHAAVDIARHVAEKQVSSAPFFVMDVPAVLNAVDQWQKNMERFKPFYALRCNADPVLAQLLAETQGMGFEVVNMRELSMTMSLVDPSKIIFSSPFWTRKTMRLAGEAGVGTVVISSEKELFDAVSFAPCSRILLAVSIPDCPLREESLGSNRGCSLEEATDILKLIDGTCANFAGFAFNVDNKNTSVYDKAMKTMRELWSVAQEYGLSPNTISVGGGFRIPKEEQNHFREVCNALHDSVNYYFPQDQFPHLKFIATPGRFFATAAFSLCTSVIGKREVEACKLTDNVPFYVYQTNEGIYGAFACRLADCEPECKPLNEQQFCDGQESVGVILGPTLTKMDVAQREFRSRQLSVGEWLLWENMGAYTMSVDDDDDFLAHPVYYFSGKDKWELINKRRTSHHQLETISDSASDGASDVPSDDDEDRLASFFDNYF